MPTVCDAKARALLIWRENLRSVFANALSASCHSSVSRGIGASTGGRSTLPFPQQSDPHTAPSFDHARLHRAAAVHSSGGMSSPRWLSQHRAQCSLRDGHQPAALRTTRLEHSVLAALLRDRSDAGRHTEQRQADARSAVQDYPAVAERAALNRRLAVHGLVDSALLGCTDPSKVHMLC